MTFKSYEPFIDFNFFDAFQVSEEVEMPITAAEFTVRYSFKANGDLFIYGFCDFFVFYLAKARCIKLTFCKSGTRFFYGFRSQEATDYIIFKGTFFNCFTHS